MVSFFSCPVIFFCGVRIFFCYASCPRKLIFYKTRSILKTKVIAHGILKIIRCSVVVQNIAFKYSNPSVVSLVDHFSKIELCAE